MHTVRLLEKIPGVYHAKIFLSESVKSAGLISVAGCNGGNSLSNCASSFLLVPLGLEGKLAAYSSALHGTTTIRDQLDNVEWGSLYSLILCNAWNSTLHAWYASCNITIRFSSIGNRGCTAKVPLLKSLIWCVIHVPSSLVWSTAIFLGELMALS
jgi:hypothetical protein